MTLTPPTQHTFCMPDPSLWLPPDAIGTVVTHDGKTYRVLGIYFAAGPEGHDDTLHQYWIAEEVDPQDIPRWYLLRTRPGSEAVAERALEAAGITVLLPRLYFEAPPKKVRRRGRPPKDTPRDKVELLFPGCVLVQLAPGDAESWSRLRQVQGIAGLLGTAPEPLPVPDQVVDTIMEWSAGSVVIVYARGGCCGWGPATGLGARGGHGSLNACSSSLRRPRRGRGCS